MLAHETMNTRRQFLKMMGTSALAVAITPTLLKSAPPLRYEAVKSYHITPKSGRTFFGWLDSGIVIFYEYGTSGVSIKPAAVASLREVTWHEAVANLDAKGLPPDLERTPDCRIRARVIPLGPVTIFSVRRS
jgi:hypothetical protein